MCVRVCVCVCGVEDKHVIKFHFMHDTHMHTLFMHVCVALFILVKHIKTIVLCITTCLLIN